MAVRHYCGQCGKELKPDDRFCSSCGNPIPQPDRVPTPEADVPVPTPHGTAPQGVREVSPRIEFWSAVGAGIVLGLVVFGVCSLFGVNGIYALLAACFVGIVAFSHARHDQLKKRPLARTTPVRSRSIPQWVKIAVATRDGGTCRRCGSSYDLQYDHVIPYSRGGSSTDVNNIQLLCGKCNRRKSNRYIG